MAPRKHPVCLTHLLIAACCVIRRTGSLTPRDQERQYNQSTPFFDKDLTHMRKPRDFDAELKALGDKARDLKSRKVQQLGELVIATGADTLTANELAGALIVLAETKEAGKREAWAKRGTAFFQGRSRRTAQ